MKAHVSRAPAPIARAARARPLARARAGAEIRLAAARLSAPVQPLLQVGAVDDPLEREAERTADRVTSMAAPPAARPAPGPNGQAARPLRRAAAEGQPSLDQLETDPPIPAELQEPTVAPAEDVPMEKLDAADMDEITAGQPGDGGDSGGEAQPLRRAAEPAPVGPAGGAAPARVAARVAAPGPGRPLPPAVAAFMEPRFGQDFRDVRLHSEPADREASAQIGARAFTHGTHIWLGPGERADDHHLLAHELTHVVQQTRVGAAPAAGGAALPARVQRSMLADQVEKVARHVPGYPLLSVILGRSPITGESIPRTAETLIGGVLSLIPGGEVLVERLNESHAIQKAYDWVLGRLGELNITWDRVKAAVGDLLSWGNITSPREAVRRTLGPILDSLETFALDLKDKLLELIVKGALTLAGPLAEQVWGVFQEARENMGLVLEDPLKFAKNLFAAVGKGFGQFGANIVDHLKRGLMGWLFGALGGAGIQLPDKLDLKGLLSVGLQVVGLTWRQFRVDIVQALEPNGEAKVAFAERAVGVVQTLITEGFSGIWSKMLELIDGFKATVLGGIKTFVTQTIVTQAIAWLASLSNPIGGIVRVLKAAYDIVTVFLERLQQILELARSVFASIGAIARGNIDQAANFVEQTMGRTVPIIISFLAGLLGLGGVSARIRDIIQKIQAPVARARARLVGFLIKKAKQVISRVIKRINRARRPPSTPFKFMGVDHEMIGETKGGGTKLYIASGDEKPVDARQTDTKTAIGNRKQKGDTDPNFDPVLTVMGAPLDETERAVEAVKPESGTENKRRESEAAKQKTKAEGEAITAASEPLKDNPGLDAKSPDAFVRAVEPRPMLNGQPVEGRAETYRELKRDVLDQASKGAAQPLSVFYERDHLPSKAILFALKEEIEGGSTFVDTPAGAAAKTVKNPPEGAGAPTPDAGDPIREADSADPPPAGPVTATPAPKGPTGPAKGAGDFGPLLTSAATETGEDLYAMVVYKPVHNAKTSATALTKATAKALIQGAVAGKSTRQDKIKAVSRALRAELESEVRELVGLYSGDANATNQIRSSAKAGLDRIIQLNENFNLKRDAAETGADGAMVPFPTADMAKGSSHPSAQRNRLLAHDIAAEKGAEGEVKAYKAFGLRGDHTEADHVLDKTLPLSALRTKTDEASSPPRTFGDAKLVDKLGLTDALIPSDLKPAARRKAMATLTSLKNLPFNAAAGPLPRGYNLNDAQTMLLYRPLAARVTTKTRLGNAWGAMVETFGKSQTDAIRKHILGEADVSTVYADFKTPVRTLLSGQFERHMAVIKTEYDGEMARMLKLNPKEPKLQAASAYSEALKARINAGSSVLRADVDKLF